MLSHPAKNKIQWKTLYSLAGERPRYEKMERWHKISAIDNVSPKISEVASAFKNLL